MSRRLIFLLLAFLGIACAVHYPYVSDYPLTPEIFRTRDGNLTGHVPQGWFCSTDDTLAPALAAWLIKDDFSAALSIRELKLDALTIKCVQEEGLPLLASISYGMNGDGSSIRDNQLQKFSYGTKQYAGYEIGSGTQTKRIIVFSAHGKYYECEIRVTSGTWTPQEMNRLFTIQQSVLASLNL
jgi:hypothetical protein